MKAQHAAPTEDIKELARKLGFDLFIHGMRDDRANWPAGVLDGFLLAQSRHQPQRLSDRYQRKWLQIRLGALRRQRQIDARVTPAMLKEIDVEESPVMRCRLTHCAHATTDWSIDRLNNGGAYAPHNLAVISTQAIWPRQTARMRKFFPCPNCRTLPMASVPCTGCGWRC